MPAKLDQKTTEDEDVHTNDQSLPAKLYQRTTMDDGTEDVHTNAQSLLGSETDVEGVKIAVDNLMKDKDSEPEGEGGGAIVEKTVDQKQQSSEKDSKPKDVVNIYENGGAIMEETVSQGRQS